MAASDAAASSATGASAMQSAQLSWLRESEQEAQHDDLSQLLSETKGVVEKLADPAVKLGSWQVVLWQPRMIFADADGLSYQKIDPNEAPIGKAKRIEFASGRRRDDGFRHSSRLSFPSNRFVARIARIASPRHRFPSFLLLVPFHRITH